MALKLSDPVPELEVAEAIQKLAPDFQFLLEGAGVPQALLAKLAKLEIITADIFAMIEPDIKEFRSFCAKDLGVDPAGGVGNKVALAKLANAWETANVRGRKRREEEADQRVGDLPRKLPRTTHLDLRRSFQNRHAELRDDVAPHPDYVETKLQQIEDGELKAERLSEVLAMSDDDGTTTTGLELNQDGTLKAKRTSTTKGQAPRDSEQLRSKLKTMGHMWEYIRLKVPGKTYLSGYDMALWDKYADHLLGEKVLSVSISTASGRVSCKPSWALVLDYDLEFRKKMAWHFNNSTGTLADFMQSTYKDETLYQTKFLTPLSLDAGAAAARAAIEAGGNGNRNNSQNNGGHNAADATFYPPPPKPWGKGKEKKGGGKGKGTGKGKGDKSGKGKGKKEGKGNVCWRFQRGNCQGPCDRRHVCLICDSPSHGSNACPAKTKAEH